MLYLAQENYLDMIFKLFNMTNYKPASTPMCKGTIVYKKSCPTNKIEIKELENVLFAQAIRSFIYAVTNTRSDILRVFETQTSQKVKMSAYMFIKY